MKAIRIGICTLLVFTVAAHGAVEPWSESVLECGAALLLLLWAFLFARGSTQGFRWNWLLAPIIGFWGIALAQYFAHWTLAAFSTRIEILKLTALLILAFLAIQTYRTVGQWRSFVWFLLVLGFVVSMFGIVQYFTFNGKLYWLRPQSGSYPFGPYVDRDHFAGLVELIIPSGLALLFTRAEDGDRTFLAGVLTLVPIGAIFLTGSRGGVSSFAVESAVVLVLAFLQRRSKAELLASGLALAAVGAFVAWIGVGRVATRFGNVRGLQVSQARRVEMIKDSWRIFLDHPLIGTGLGSLQTVFPKYETLYDGYVVNHAHNDYVEALAETGIAGGLCGGVFLCILFAGAWRGFEYPRGALESAQRIGALGACCGLLFHSLVDFNLHIPSNGLLFLLQACFATWPAANRGSSEMARGASRGDRRTVGTGEKKAAAAAD